MVDTISPRNGDGAASQTTPPQGHFDLASVIVPTGCDAVATITASSSLVADERDRAAA